MWGLPAAVLTVMLNFSGETPATPERKLKYFDKLSWTNGGTG